MALARLCRSQTYSSSEASALPSPCRRDTTTSIRALCCGLRPGAPVLRGYRLQGHHPLEGS